MRQPIRAWLFPLIMALLAGVGGIATHLVADYIHPRLAEYRWAPWVVFGIFLASAFLAVVRNARKATSSDNGLGSAKTRASINIGGDSKGINVAGNGNLVVHRDNED